MLWKCSTQYVSKFGKLSSVHNTGKDRLSFQSQRKALPKNVKNYCTIALISHASKVILKILQARLQQYVNCELPDIKLVLEKAEEPEHLLDHQKSKRVPEKHLLLLYWLCQSLWLCGSQQTVENSESDGNTRPPDLPLEKPVCRSGSNNQNWTWNNRMVPNRKRSTSRLYIITLLI